MSFVLINNDPTEYNTSTKLLEAINGLTRIAPLSGVIKKTAGDSFLVLSYAYYNSSAQDFYCLGAYLNGTIENGSGQVSLKNFIEMSSSVIADGVNLIN